ncbi:rheacalcin-1-like [Pantherophis guttatus]|uniref:Rheacalcin-1-like n=1 Tax=Pantherophis guttatus TaxID=94885 RepID=A0A6P9D198_PANGU|nr:rheacalcin-1-like [Pantherophis guttatus]XP_034285961.1 rheacalcin-1-like [Pantherophis guttatus]
MAPFSLGLLICLVLVPFAADAQADLCPGGWLSYNGHCYGYFEQEVNWQQAETFCQSHNGHLASIQTREEHQAVANFLTKAQWWEREDVWLGLFLPSNSRTWAWVDGSPVGYTAWEKHYRRSWKTCAALDDSYGFMLWDDDSCYDRNPFLCKSLAVAAPTQASQGGQPGQP